MQLRALLRRRCVHDVKRVLHGPVVVLVNVSVPRPLPGNVESSVYVPARLRSSVLTWPAGLLLLFTSKIGLPPVILPAPFAENFPAIPCAKNSASAPATLNT